MLNKAITNIFSYTLRERLRLLRLMLSNCRIVRGTNQMLTLITASPNINNNSNRDKDSNNFMTKISTNKPPKDCQNILYSINLVTSWK